MRTIQDVFKKVDEMKKELTDYDSHFEDDEVVDRRNRERGFNKALEDVKPVIEKGIKEILEELALKGMINPDACGDLEKSKLLNISKMLGKQCGSNEREQKLRESIEEIIN